MKLSMVQRCSKRMPFHCCKQQGGKLRYTRCFCLGACHCPLWQPCNCSSHCVGILQVGDWYPVTNLVTTLHSCCHVMYLHMNMHICTAAAVMSFPCTCSLESQQVHVIVADAVWVDHLCMIVYKHTWSLYDWLFDKFLHPSNLTHPLHLSKQHIQWRLQQGLRHTNLHEFH